MGLWVPMDSERKPRFACANCPDHPEFDDEAKYIRHVGRCVRRNPPAPPEKNMVNSYLDPEQMEWVNKAKAEGKRMKGIVGARYFRK